MKEKWRVKKNHRVLWDVVYDKNIKKTPLSWILFPTTITDSPEPRMTTTPLRPLFGNADSQVIFHCTVTMGTETPLLASPLASPVFLFFFFFLVRDTIVVWKKIHWITLLTHWIASDSSNSLSVAQGWLPPAPPAMSLRRVHSIRSGRMGWRW